MAKLLQITVTMSAIQAQLKKLSTTSTNPTRTKRKFYCWIYRINFTNGSKTFSSRKVDNKEEAYYKKILGVSEKGR